MSDQRPQQPSISEAIEKNERQKQEIEGTIESLQQKLEETT